MVYVNFHLASNNFDTRE